MGQTWDIMFDFLKPSSTLDPDNDCATISAADVLADPLATASLLEVRIPKALAIQQLWGCTFANDLGVMGQTERLGYCVGWRMWLVITATISSSNYRPFRRIGSWLPHITGFPSRLGCLLKDVTVSSSSCRTVRILGSWLIFSTSSSASLGKITLL